MRFKAWNAQATQLSDMSFMKTYEFIDFECKKNDYDNKLECNWKKGSSVQPADAEKQLDAEDEWDEKTYAPLSDVRAGEKDTTNTQFIVKFTKAGDKQDGYVKKDFEDEEKTTKTFKVHECWKEHLVIGQIYVAHRVRILDGVGTIDAMALLTDAPPSYDFEA